MRSSIGEATSRYRAVWLGEAAREAAGAVSCRRCRAVARFAFVSNPSRLGEAIRIQTFTVQRKLLCTNPATIRPENVMAIPETPR